MTQEDYHHKQCCDCGKLIQFENFRAMHPTLGMPDAVELYNNPLIGVYCPDCWFKRPEKPFKKRKRLRASYFSKGPNSKIYYEK